MKRQERVYIIVRGETVLARCYSKEEVRNRLRELLKVEFITELDLDEQNKYFMRIDIWMEGKFSGHSYNRQGFSLAVANVIWRDVLKSDWFYNDTGIEVFETCGTLEDE